MEEPASLQVADGNAGLVLGEVSIQREGVINGALGVPLTWESGSSAGMSGTRPLPSGSHSISGRPKSRLRLG